MGKGAVVVETLSSNVSTFLLMVHKVSLPSVHAAVLNRLLNQMVIIFWYKQRNIFMCLESIYVYKSVIK